MNRKKTKNALEILDRMIGQDRDLQREIEEETLNSHVASLLYEARTRAGLTQRGLADIVGTTQSVISRLESSNYEGHSLSMLVRIARALDRTVEVRLVSRRKKRRSA
jgi:ribosome-binding protein aMBF1 (putative translation factor)